ncbi:tetrahydrofolate dehydrogenase/cyclohydrolase catalytic domain-containing protein, partial [Acaryochloris thomasi]|uniref:tetrahydrofolate dehydrogenase/cyclohydrolase catalytic domain-containing protein n=1 Tax=Acaryochloris thomasi TaxID=2929456 RepID=UPI0011B68B09
MDEVRGREILPSVKERCEVYRSNLADKNIKIVRFAPGINEHIDMLPQYEAARYSTESKIKTFQHLNCNVESLLLPQETSVKEFNRLLTQLNSNPNTVGIIVQNPVPKDLRDSFDLIGFEKDLDGMRTDNPYFSTSATSETIYRLVESFAQEGDTVAVVGARGFVGRGVVKLLKEAGIELAARRSGLRISSERQSLPINPIEIPCPIEHDCLHCSECISR